jgi:hypothetical protein
MALPLEPTPTKPIEDATMLAGLARLPGITQRVLDPRARPAGGAAASMSCAFPQGSKPLANRELPTFSEKSQIPRP